MDKIKNRTLELTLGEFFSHGFSSSVLSDYRKFTHSAITRARVSMCTFFGPDWYEKTVQDLISSEYCVRLFNPEKYLPGYNDRSRDAVAELFGRCGLGEYITHKYVNKTYLDELSSEAKDVVRLIRDSR